MRQIRSANVQSTDIEPRTKPKLKRTAGEITTKLKMNQGSILVSANLLRTIDIHTHTQHDTTHTQHHTTTDQHEHECNHDETFEISDKIVRDTAIKSDMMLHHNNAHIHKSTAITNNRNDKQQHHSTTPTCGSSPSIHDGIHTHVLNTPSVATHTLPGACQHHTIAHSCHPIGSIVNSMITTPGDRTPNPWDNCDVPRLPRTSASPRGHYSVHGHVRHQPGGIRNARVCRGASISHAQQTQEEQRTPVGTKGLYSGQVPTVFCGDKGEMVVPHPLLLQVWFASQAPATGARVRRPRPSRTAGVIRSPNPLCGEEAGGLEPPPRRNPKQRGNRRIQEAGCHQRTRSDPSAEGLVDPGEVEAIALPHSGQFRSGSAGVAGKPIWRSYPSKPSLDIPRPLASSKAASSQMLPSSFVPRVQPARPHRYRQGEAAERAEEVEEMVPNIDGYSAYIKSRIDGRQGQTRKRIEIAEPRASPAPSEKWIGPAPAQSTKFCLVARVVLAGGLSWCSTTMPRVKCPGPPRLDPVQVIFEDVSKALVSPERNDQLRGHGDKRPEIDEKHTSRRWFEESNLKSCILAPRNSILDLGDLPSLGDQPSLGELPSLGDQAKMLAESQLARVPIMKPSLRTLTKEDDNGEGEARDADSEHNTGKEPQR